MQRIIFLVILLIIALGMSACESIEHGDFATSVSGTVIDSITHTPIDSAVLYLINGEATHAVGFSDTLGAYHFISWGYGPFIISFHKQGYTDKSITVEGSDNQLTFTDVIIELADTTISK